MDVIRGVMALLGSAIGVTLVGVPILFGLVAMWMGKPRGRPGLVAYNLGVWLGPFYLLFLVFQRDRRWDEAKTWP